jgi:hypothetical protein
MTQSHHLAQVFGRLSPKMSRNAAFHFNNSEHQQAEVIFTPL